MHFCYVLEITFKVKKRDLFEIWVSSKDNEKLINVNTGIRTLLGLHDISEKLESVLNEKSSYFCLNATRMWKSCYRSRICFENRHKKWLDNSIDFSQWILTNARENINKQPVFTRGRPRKCFEEASTKTKKRRVQELVGKSPAELRFAAERSEQLSNSLTNEAKILSPQKALALFFDLNLSVRKYNILRQVVNSMHKDCFPSYHVLTQTKQQYLPSEITVSEISAQVELQPLLEKTVDSILKISNNILNSSLKLICKWGFDGSSGHSFYKQKFREIGNTDEYLFFAAFVPLRLVNETNKNDIVWLNLRTSSTLFCRPIKFIFSKETSELIRSEKINITNSINKLITYHTCYEGKELNISFELIFTMFDGSVANVLSDTNASSRCIVCGASPKEMNSVNVIHKPPKIQNYSFGISSLHCWIRFFECLLHIAYRLPLKIWQVKGNENKQIFEENNKRIQLEFRSKMGLIVDKPKPGCGSTNDGNTARRFFQNPDLSAEITGIDKQLITNFSTILRVLASGCRINLDKFGILLNNTRDLYLNLYSWYYMPSSIHKVLIHGCAIIEFFDLPIGQLSKEALEARHKEIRRIRLCHTRKSSRINTNMDMIKTLLLTSDPELSSYRKTASKKAINFDNQILEYLINDQIDEPTLGLTNINLEENLSSSDDEEKENIESESEFE